MSSQVWTWSDEGVEAKHAEELNLNLKDRRLRLTLDLAHQLMGAPRHLSQHPGGFVLTRDRLDELVPIEPAAMKDRQVIEWDKDDIDTLKFMKVDCLALGMLSLHETRAGPVEGSQGREAGPRHHPGRGPAHLRHDQEGRHAGRLPDREPRAGWPCCRASSPRTFYDLVIEVAIVRPGPIQGDMVHPYLRRREGKEPVDYPKPELERGARQNAGRAAVPGAGHAGGHRVRRLHRRRGPTSCGAPWRRSSSPAGVSHFKDKLVGGMVERGYAQAFAERTFSQLEGFGSYGFPESHAASFALIAYASSWLKCWHPDAFCAALLNAPAHGLLRPGPDRARCARARGGGAPGLRQRIALGTALWSGSTTRTPSRCAWACARCGACPTWTPRPSSPRERIGRSPRWTTSGGAPACRGRA